MIAQLVIGLVILAALGGAFLSWKSDIRAEGEHKVIAEMERLQKAQDLKNLEIAQKGEQEKTRLLDEAQKRTRQQAAKLAATQQLMREQSDARAKVDLQYAAWRETALPEYVDGRVRRAFEPTSAVPDSRVMPPGAEIQPGEGIAATPAAETDKSRLARIAGILGLGNSGHLASRR